MAELSSHHNTQTITKWGWECWQFKTNLHHQGAIKMQMVQKIRNAVAEKENFVIFRDVLKDSNSQKIVGRKTIQGGLIWFSCESKMRKRAHQTCFGLEIASPTYLVNFEWYLQIWEYLGYRQNQNDFKWLTTLKLHWKEVQAILANI